jgi:hypothetical protein
VSKKKIATKKTATAKRNLLQKEVRRMKKRYKEEIS